MAELEIDQGVQAGEYAPGMDKRYSEPFNLAIRDVCKRFGYAPTNDAIDALKRDMRMGSDLYGKHLAAMAARMRSGEVSFDQWHASLSATLGAVAEAVYGRNEAFALHDLVNQVEALAKRAQQRDLEQMR